VTTKYVVKKQKTNGSGEKFYKQIGTVVINEGEGTGVLYLDMFDGNFRLFTDEYYDNQVREKETQYGEEEVEEASSTAKKAGRSRHRQPHDTTGV